MRRDEPRAFEPRAFEPRAFEPRAFELTLLTMFLLYSYIKKNRCNLLSYIYYTWQQKMLASSYRHGGEDY